MSLSSLFCVIARLVSPLPSSLRAGERRSAHTAPRPRERRARASPQTLFTVTDHVLESPLLGGVIEAGVVYDPAEAAASRSTLQPRTRERGAPRAPFQP